MCGKAYFTRDDTPDLPYSDLNILFLGHCGFLNKPTRIPFKVIYIIVWFITFLYQILNWIGINQQVHFVFKSLMFYIKITCLFVL